MNPDLKGILLRIGATFFFSLMVLFIKLLAGEISTGQIVFYRSAFALIPLVLFLFITNEFPRGLYTKRPMGHVFRCILGCCAMFTSFASLRYLPIAHSTVIGYLAPILAVLLARIVLKEHVTKARMIGIAGGFSGMLVLVLPDMTTSDPDLGYLLGVGLGFATAILTAGAVTQIRSLTKTENAGAIAFYFALTCALVGLATCVFGWKSPGNEQLGLLIGSGIAGGIAHIMMTLSYKLAPVSKLATFEYLSIAFAVTWDLVFFAILPNPNFYVSVVLIVGSALVVAFGDRVIVKEKRSIKRC